VQFFLWLFFPFDLPPELLFCKASFDLPCELLFCKASFDLPCELLFCKASVHSVWRLTVCCFVAWLWERGSRFCTMSLILHKRNRKCTFRRSPMCQRAKCQRQQQQCVPVFLFNVIRGKLLDIKHIFYCPLCISTFVFTFFTNTHSEPV